jgi:hypothetical protein
MNGSLIGRDPKSSPSIQLTNPGCPFAHATAAALTKKPPPPGQHTMDRYAAYRLAIARVLRRRRRDHDLEDVIRVQP